MHRLLLCIEPVIWFLFGQGLLLGTMLLTGWVAVVGLAVPLGWVSPDALAYERALALGSNPLGRLVLAAVIALPLWKGAHHVRHLFIDFVGVSRDAIVAPVLYAIAALGSLGAIVAVIRL